MKVFHAGASEEGEQSSPRPLADRIDSLERENAELRAKNADLAADAARSADRMDLLLTFGRAGTETLEVKPLVERVIGLAVDALGADAAMIHLVNKDRLRLIGFRSASGPPPPGASEVVAEMAVDDDSISGRAALSRKTITVGRSEWPSATIGLVAHLSACFGTATPLMVGERMVGTICVIRRRDSPFTADDLRLLEISAVHIAAAIEHARLLDEERQRLRDLAAINELGALIAQHLELSAVLSTGVRQLSRITDTANTFLLLFEDAETLRVAASSVEDPALLDFSVSVRSPSAVSEAIRLNAPVLIADAQSDPRASRELAARFGHHTILAVPLLSRGKAIGTVVVCEARPGRSFTTLQVSSTLAICNQLASAIVNARLFDDLKQSYHDLGQTQEALVARERLAALGELAAVVAHEVRNPLGIIWNSLGTLQRLLHPTGDVATLLSIVGEESDRLNRMVGDLLDFARPHALDLRPESVEAVLTGAIEAARGAGAAKPIAFVRLVDPDLPPVLADVRLLRQAFVNLVLNAMQAMPEGGQVTVRATTDLSSGSARAHVDIIDEGPGIPADEAEHVFQPFYTTKATGTGLGLAVVKRIVLAHHGEVSAASLPEGGTTFSVRIPFAPRDR